jgi:hypothetical protein
MEDLNLPNYSFKLFREGKKTKIFDAIRKKKIVLTPEEWVRQNFIQFLVQEKSFPIGLIAVEKGLKLNGMQKRTDILCYSKVGNPILMVECKAPNIPINQLVFDQISRYNLAFKLPYLIVTNGLKHYCAMINFEKKNFNFLKEIPSYDELN